MKKCFVALVSVLHVPPFVPCLERTSEVRMNCGWKSWASVDEVLGLSPVPGVRAARSMAAVLRHRCLVPGVFAQQRRRL